MKALDKKLFRDVMHIWTQVLAVALVMAAGVATIIIAVGAHRSLEGTRAAYYERYRFADGEFAHNLYDLPHDALVLSGAYGHGLIKNILFGSKAEITQATLTNNILVSGPHSRTHLN